MCGRRECVGEGGGAGEKGCVVEGNVLEREEAYVRRDAW